MRDTMPDCDSWVKGRGAYPEPCPFKGRYKYKGKNFCEGHINEHRKKKTKDPDMAVRV